MRGFQSDPLFNEKGFGVVSNIVASGLIMGAVFLLLFVIQFSVRNYQRTQTTLAMVQAEVNLVTFYNSYESLKPLTYQFRKGDVYAQTFLLDGVKVGRIGGPLYLDEMGEECSAGSSNQCLIRVETDIDCTPQSSGSLCKAAYRITSSNQDLKPLGVSHNGSFQAEDYTIPISYEISLREDVHECDPDSDLFSAGMVKSTGKMWCLKKPLQACQSGQIAKGLKFDAVSGSLEMICENTQTMRCPANYVLASINPSSLEMGQGKVGECVFVTKKSVPWKQTPPPAASVSGTYCPKHYRAQASCSVTVTSQWNGSCSYSCNCVTDPKTKLVSCDTCYYSVGPSNVGNYSFSQSGRTASCSIQPGGQSCGAGWTGVVHLTGSCELEEPERVGVL